MPDINNQTIEDVNIVNPEGDLVALPKNQIEDALAAGYRQLTPEDIHNYKLQSTYGTPGQTALGLAEQAAKGAIPFGGAAALERTLGIKPEDILGREEALPPFAGGAAEITGLIGSSFIPGGQGALLEKLGAKVVPEALQGAGLISKVGSAAVKGAVETGAYQGNNEIHKMILQPDLSSQAVGAALSDIGLATAFGGVLGGGFGVVSPLWQQTVGKKLGGFLEAVQRRANGESVSLSPELEKAVGTSALDIAPEIKSALSDDPQLANQWQKLQESTTTPGIDAQKALHDFKISASDNIVNILGKDVSEIPNLSDISHFEEGTKLQHSLSDEIRKNFEPISKEFNSIRDQFSKIPLTAEQDIVADKLALLGEKERWNVPSLPQNKLLQETITDLPHLKDLEDLRRYQSNIWGKVSPQDGNMWNAAGKIVSTLREVENQTLERAAGVKGPDTLMRLQVARSAYGDAANILEDLNSRLHVGKYTGPESFLNALKEMKPEDVLNRLSKNNDAGLLTLLQTKFPTISNMVKENVLNNILSKASIKAPEGHAINTKTLLNAIDKMSPEMRNFAIPQSAQARINATRTILDKLPERMNPSGTAKTLDSLWNKMPGSAAAVVGALFGHGIVGKAVSSGIGFMLGQVGKWLGRDVPDAVRLGFLKFLGQEGPVNAGAFKTAVDLAVAATRGETALNKGVKNLFRAGRIEMSQVQEPSDKEKQRLDKRISDLMVDNTKLLNIGGDLSYYMPDHARELASTAMNAVNYLSSLKPKTDRPGILDADRIPSEVEKYKYDRALTITERPLILLNDIKEGSISPDDVVTLKNVHPGLYERMSQKIFNEITEVEHKGDIIPYPTKIGLSMFLAQPLENSLSPMGIKMNQLGQMSQQMSQMGQNMSQLRKPPSGAKMLTGLVKSSQTTDQARLQHKLERA